MSAVALVLVIALPTLAGLAAAGWGIWFAVRQVRRRHTDTQATTYAGPNGPVVRIPVMQISRLLPGQSLIAAGRVTGHASFEIHPHGIEYRIAKRTFVPFNAVTQVDAPYPSRPYMTLQVTGFSGGIGVVATAEPALRHALWQLAHYCQLTHQARARIAQ